MGLVPTHWGPFVWGSIHLICIGAPSVLDATAQENYRAFFNMLPNVIPCETCSVHLRQNLKTLPVDAHLATNKELFAWSVALHNLVNKQLNKPIMSFDLAEKHWRQVCESKTSDYKAKSNIPMYILFMIIGMMIASVSIYLAKALL
jgi:hypothetical protein